MSFASETDFPTTAEATPAFTFVFLTSAESTAEPKLDAIPPATNAAVFESVEISEPITLTPVSEASPLPAAIPEISDTPLSFASATAAFFTENVPSARPITPPTYSAPLSVIFSISISATVPPQFT